VEIEVYTDGKGTISVSAACSRRGCDTSELVYNAVAAVHQGIQWGKKGP
jgi:hypothetical protein